jgi:amino acid adenylation domain-containing protein
MNSFEELKTRAKAGDLHALQQLRDQGFFQASTAADGYPVSHAQRRLWIVDQMVDGLGAYNIPVGLRLDGVLNAAVLRHALQLLVRRHESLRTTFVATGGDVRQVVHDSLELPWTEIDLGDDPDPELSARQIAQDEANRRFDLARGPLLRTTLIRLAPARHIFLLTIHHIVSDLTSLRLLLHELSICYQARASDSEPALASLPIQYKDFASWQNRMLAGPEAARHRSYWLDQLAGLLSPLELPADLPRPPLKTFDGKICRIAVDAVLTQQLRQLGVRRGLTLFMVLAATLKILLYRYTGQPDIIVGFPVAGRNHPDTAEQIGCFVNVLALRDRLTAEESIAAVLGKIRQTMLDAYEHQAYPFDKLVEELELPRDMSRSPVFDVLLSLAHADEARSQIGDLNVSAWENGYAAAKADMSFDFFETPDGLELAITYSTDLFAADRVRRMAEHYVRLMRAAVDDPLQDIGRIELMSPEERHRVLVEFNRTRRPFPQDKTLVDLFERHANQQPHAIAVRIAGRELSYDQLNQAANRLAARLEKSGVGLETLVSVLLEPSLDLVTGFLAILKAGGVYLPLDPANPDQRLADMLDDAGSPVILTQASLADRLPAAMRSRILLCDGAFEASADQPADSPVRLAGLDHAAYAIFTSGSSGRAKAAMLLHRGLANMISEQAQLFAPRRGDHVLQFAALGFDASVFEFALAFAHGATLCLARRDDLMPGPPLLATLEREEISMALLPPSAMAALPDANLPKLRMVAVGGEACTTEVVRRWAPGRALFNLYGPTEITVFATAARCQPDERPLTIGRPIGNTRIYLLDARLQPVPLGVAGELCIAGQGLARHYLNRPDLTAASFIRDPFDAAPDARLYRTGDLARYLTDGSIEFLGRIDAQVKLRGYRIELGEIEASLERHPAVREAIVLAREGVTGRRLVAYATTDTTQPVDVGELRRFLRDKLPEYMVPAHFVLLEEMPQTPNNKIDRKALAALDIARLSPAVPMVAPRDEIEHVLAGLFCELLKAEQVGADSNFFELGGDSLLATRIVSRLREIFRAEITVPQLFRAGTLGALAEMVRSAHPAGHAEKIAGALRRLQQMSPAQRQELLDRSGAREARLA